MDNDSSHREVSTVKLFLSYAGVDRNRARTVAQALEAAHGIELFWDKKDLGWGDNWQHELEQALQDCNAFLLLVSSGGVRNWTLAETRVALSRHFGVSDESKRLLILPLLLPEAKRDILPPFLQLFQIEDWPEDYQPGDTQGTARWLLPLLQKRLDDRKYGRFQQIKWDSDRNPFRGLQAYRREDKDVFFGRRQDIAELLTRLGWFEGGRRKRWLQIEGESGSGKSSLIHAGLLPAIASGWHGLNTREQQYQWIILEPMRPRRNVLTELATTLHHHSGRPIPDIEARLRAPDDRALALLLREVRPSEYHVLLLVIDQFEELLTVQADPQEVDRFDKLLAHALEDEGTGLYLITGVRSDLLNFEPLPGLQSRLHTLCTRPQFSKVDERRLREIIFDLPAALGLEWSDPQLPEEILAQTLKEPAPLSPVQFILSHLWEAGDHRHLERRHFDPRHGKSLGTKLGEAAEQLLQGLDGKESNALNLLLELTTYREGYGYSRRPLGYKQAEQTAGGAEIGAHVIRRLSGQWEAHTETLHLLTVTTDEHNQPQQVELVHEILLREGVWPTLWKHLEQNRERFRVRRLLELKAEDWSHARNLARWRGLATRRELRAFRGAAPTNPALTGPYLRQSRHWHRLKEFVAVMALALSIWVGETAYRVHIAEMPIGYLPRVMAARLGFLPSFDLDMVNIPPGTFKMGSESSPYTGERPVHEVTINYAFQMSRYEITFEQYEVYVLDKITTLTYVLDKAKTILPSDQGWGRGDQPVINVHWQDAVDYASWLSEQWGQTCRLPSEAEWEYAARAGGTGDYGLDENGEQITEANLGDYAWYEANSEGQTQPVGGKEGKKTKPNAWGLHDMYGNVWEWVQDCLHDNYRDAPGDGSAWEATDGGDCRQRVLRGGAWFNPPVNLRASVRGFYRSDGRLNHLGIRVVCLPHQ